MSKIFFNTVLALLLVSAGVFLLLINLGILPLSMLEIWEYFYPLVFMALGIKWIMDGFSSRRRRGGSSHGWFWGLAFLTVGTLLFLSKLDIIFFSLHMVWQLWPLLLIYLGISIMSDRNKRINFRIEHDGWEDSSFSKRSHEKRKRNYNKNSEAASGSDPGDDRPKGEWHSTNGNPGGGSHFVRSLHYNKPNWTVEPMDVWQGVGDYHFDFSRAFIPERETLIKLSGWVGDIDIFLPGDVAFKVDAQANVGDMNVLRHKQDGINPYVHYKSPDYDEAERKLAFDFDFKVLDLHIERV